MDRVEIVAEIGSNFATPNGGSLDRALKLIEAAASSGADAVKFQLLRGRLLYRDEEKQKSLKSSEIPIEWLPQLKSRAEDLGMVFFVTPFYPEAIDILEELNVARYKVASWDLTYTPLLEAISKTKKPVYMSTGASPFDVVEQAIQTLRPGKQPVTGITLLHCNGGYPTPVDEIDMRRVLDLAINFSPLPAGFSAHIVNPYLVASSILLGAKVIEVHFDLADRAGKEQRHSYVPSQFSELVKFARLLHLAYGDGSCCGDDPSLPIPMSTLVARDNYFRDPSDWLRPVKK